MSKAHKLILAEARLEKIRAQLAGEKKYPGQPCKCGAHMRYSATGSCCDCTYRRAIEQRTRTPRKTIAGLSETITVLELKLRAALAAEERAQARIVELEDSYEPGQHEASL